MFHLISKLSIFNTFCITFSFEIENSAEMKFFNWYTIVTCQKLPPHALSIWERLKNILRYVIIFNAIGVLAVQENKLSVIESALTQ